MKFEVSRSHNQKIGKKLDNLYLAEKSKGFALHLIRSYIPFNKVNEVHVGSKCSCTLCKKDLASNQQITQGSKKEKALTGENSNTYICSECSASLFNWGISKMLTGDKKIERILSNDSAEEQLESICVFMEDNNNANLRGAASSKKMKLERAPKIEKTTFGDLQILQQIKLEMETKIK